MASYKQLGIELFIPSCHMKKVEKCEQSFMSLLIEQMSLIYAACESARVLASV